MYEDNMVLLNRAWWKTYQCGNDMDRGVDINGCMYDNRNCRLTVVMTPKEGSYRQIVNNFTNSLAYVSIEATFCH